MKVYVASRNFDDVYLTSLDEAMNLLYTGRARVIAFTDQYLNVSYRERYDLAPEFRAIMEGWDRIRIPHAIVHKNGKGGLRPKFPTRHNIFERDGFLCQFDDCQNRHDLTLDHVYPQQRFKAGEFKHLPFGVRSWENLVTACQSCNNKKRDRTPEEAGMRLKKIPTTPTLLISPEVWAQVFRQEGTA